MRFGYRARAQPRRQMIPSFILSFHKWLISSPTQEHLSCATRGSRCRTRGPAVRFSTEAQHFIPDSHQLLKFAQLTRPIPPKKHKVPPRARGQRLTSENDPFPHLIRYQ